MLLGGVDHQTVALSGGRSAGAANLEFGVPDGIRTRVLTLRGWRPGPG